MVAPSALHRGAETGAEGDRYAVDGAAGDVGLVELVREQTRAPRTLVMLGRFVEPDVGEYVAVDHEVATDLVLAVREAVRMLRTCGVEQQPRGADSIAGDDHDRGVDTVHRAGLTVDVLDAVGRSGPVGGDPRDASVRSDLEPEVQRRKDVGLGRGAERSPGAPRHAESAEVAGEAASIRLGDDRVVRGPPVPPETVEPAAMRS